MSDVTMGSRDWNSEREMVPEVEEPCGRCGRDVQEIGGLCLFGDLIICCDCFEDLEQWLEVGGG